MKKIIKLIVVIVISISVLALVWYFFGYHKTWSKGKMPLVPVSAIKVEAEKISLVEELPGRVVSYNISEVRPQVNGIIIERLFEEGGKVEEGQQLYQIDPKIYKEIYARAKANLDRAQADLEYLKLKINRYDKLMKSKAISQQEYDDTKVAYSKASADVNVSSAEVSQAKTNLDYTKVYAPICGYIGKSSVTKGALVIANQQAPLATITQLDPIYVDMTISSKKLLHLKQQLKSQNEVSVTLLVEGTNYKHKGKLQFSEVTVDPTTGTVLLRAIFPNPEEILLPGMFVRVKIQIDPENYLLIPQQAAIHTNDGSVIVWIINHENQVTPQPIVVDRAIGNKWLVKDGLKDGDIIVLEGFQKIFPNVKVNPTFEVNETKAVDAKLDINKKAANNKDK